MRKERAHEASIWSKGWACGAVGGIVLFANAKMKHWMSHFDSSIVADGFALTPAHEEAWREEIERVQRLRGQVLATALVVEATIDRAIGDLILTHGFARRSPKYHPDQYGWLRGEVLSRLQFSAKTECVCSLMKLRFPELSDRVNSLFVILECVRRVRNDIAHSPVSFQALKTQSKGRLLRPLLMTARGQMHISNGFIREFVENASKASDLIADIMREGLRLRAPRIESA